MLDENVIGFEIAVHDSGAGQEIQGLGHLPHESL